MWGMFYDAPLVDPDVSNWDTSNVTEMTVMFKFAKSAKPDPSKWNTSKVVDVDQVFQATAIEKADLSKVQGEMTYLQLTASTTASVINDRPTYTRLSLMSISSSVAGFFLMKSR